MKMGALRDSFDFFHISGRNLLCALSFFLRCAQIHFDEALQTTFFDSILRLLLVLRDSGS
ncbi:MAG: hypothetical protein DMG54_01255 [Acidobacteria bacterium]|nr:MAG: hypothetical protein DMG54_01255 [Acidobacteriota bacterium]